MGHPLLVHVLVDGAVGGCSEGLEQERDLVLLDQLADHLHRLGRAVAVVVADEVDLAAVDAALVVDLLEVGGEGLADGPVGGGVAAVRVGIADLDLGGGDTHHRLSPHPDDAGQAGQAADQQQHEEPDHWLHGVLPFRLVWDRDENARQYDMPEPPGQPGPETIRQVARG